MIDQPQYLTQEGMDALENKLKHLLEVRRPEVAERLREAVEEGGELTENSEYESAKNEQAFVEGEIIRLENILRNAQLIDDSQPHDTVVPGAKVTVQEKGSRVKEAYHLVGSAEANPRAGKISIVSPMGKALLGAKVGDRVTVATPDGDIVFRVKSIE
jgi:transcription elongation factor GreA